jgi:dTMP kinase
MKEALLKGHNLVVDRYAYSGAAYTASKGYDLQWCKNTNSGLLCLDLIIFLDIPIEEAMKRGDFGQERYEKQEMQEKVREIFQSMSIEANSYCSWGF